MSLAAAAGVGNHVRCAKKYLTIDLGATSLVMASARSFGGQVFAVRDWPLE